MVTPHVGSTRSPCPIQARAKRVQLLPCLLRDTNDTWKPRLVWQANPAEGQNLTAGRAGTGVASLERLLVASLAEVVGAGVDNNGPLAEVSDENSSAGPGQRTPMTLWGPMSLMNRSATEPLELPWASVSMLPRSPTWRFSSDGAPWVLP